jgi:hypothetical protein
MPASGPDPAADSSVTCEVDPAEPATAAIPREISVAVAVCCSAAAEVVGEISRNRSTTAPISSTPPAAARAPAQMLSIRPADPEHSRRARRSRCRRGWALPAGHEGPTGGTRR